MKVKLVYFQKHANGRDTIYENGIPKHGSHITTLPLRFGYGSYNEPRKIHGEGVDADDLLSIQELTEDEKVMQAFMDLMGINGKPFAKEISETGKLSDRSYEIICDNVKFNDQKSIVEHFGLVHYYYLKGKE